MENKTLQDFKDLVAQEKAACLWTEVDWIAHDELNGSTFDTGYCEDTWLEEAIQRYATYKAAKAWEEGWDTGVKFSVNPRGEYLLENNPYKQ